YDRDPPEEVDPLGFLGNTRLAERLRDQEITDITENEITLRDKQGQRHTYKVSENTTVLLDGKTVKLTDLKAGTPLEAVVTSGGVVTEIRATSKSSINWWSVIGVIGILMAFGHSILAMSGEETLAQVYREVESPKMLNFKRAAFIVFVYSLL